MSAIYGVVGREVLDGLLVVAIGDEILVSNTLVKRKLCVGQGDLRTRNE